MRLRQIILQTSTTQAQQENQNTVGSEYEQTHRQKNTLLTAKIWLTSGYSIVRLPNGYLLLSRSLRCSFIFILTI